MTDAQMVKYYTSDKGIYISTDVRDYNGRRPVRAALVNDKYPKETHLSGWHLVEDESEVLSLKQKNSGGYINTRWEIIDNSLSNELIPLVITQEESEEYKDSDYDWHIGAKSKYHNIRSLYRRKQDRAPDYYTEIPFESEHLGRIKSEHVENICDAKFSIIKDGGWGSNKPVDVELKSIVNYYEIERMLVSDLLIHNRPCYLTSKSTFDIIRNYVKDNINGLYAQVTSDYDFCFTVKKKIGIKAYTTKQQIYTARGKSYRPPRFVSKSTEHKQVEIFEMTSAEKKYQGYTIIDGFKGDTLQDLADNIKGYLDELMAYINLPLVECETCNGTGHVLVDKFNMNGRK